MAGKVRLLSVFAAGTILVGAAPSGSVFAQKANLYADMSNLIVRHQTEHYAIAGTISDARLLEYGRCLEFIYQEYATGFAQLALTDRANVHADGVEQTKEDKKVAQRNSLSGNYGDRFPVIIFARPDEYDQFGAAYFSDSLENTRGVFLRPLKLLVIRDDANSSQTYEVLFHEAFHQFAYRFTPFIPMWANEGLATYYGLARPTSSGLRFDRPAASYCRVVREAGSARALIPLGQLMAMDRAQFYSKEKVSNLEMSTRTLCYAQAYTLVSYILSDQDGAAHLRTYLQDLAGAKDDSTVGAISDRHFGRAMLDAMTPQWLTYCQTH
jgi:hypothetical protein